jgi:hypothetical protein
MNATLTTVMNLVLIYMGLFAVALLVPDIPSAGVPQQDVADLTRAVSLFVPPAWHYMLPMVVLFFYVGDLLSDLGKVFWDKETREAAKVEDDLTHLIQHVLSYVAMWFVFSWIGGQL